MSHCRLEIESSASGTKNILYCPLEGSELKRGFGCSQQQCQGGTRTSAQEVPGGTTMNVFDKPYQAEPGWRRTRVVRRRWRFRSRTGPTGRRSPATQCWWTSWAGTGWSWNNRFLKWSQSLLALSNQTFLTLVFKRRPFSLKLAANLFLSLMVFALGRTH